MPDLLALTRDVSRSIVRCELTHCVRESIDIDRARRQHCGYERALQDLGCAVRRLPAGDDMPDSVFIEDTAVVLDEVAIVTRPGAESRRIETAAVAEVLSEYRRLVYLRAPATLDGGDVLVAGTTMLVGQTGRTNREGFEQLAHAAARYGYEVRPAGVHGCLHLKSAATALSDRTLLVNRAWIDKGDYDGFELIDVHPGEPSAANVLRVGGQLLSASAFPRTRDLLAAHGFNATIVEADELAKAEGALTCCSLLLRL